MNNIKGFAVITDGNTKRIAITYDVINDETGVVMEQNKKINRIITVDSAKESVKTLEDYAQGIIDSEQAE